MTKELSGSGKLLNEPNWGVTGSNQANVYGAKSTLGSPNVGVSGTSANFLPNASSNLIRSEFKADLENIVGCVKPKEAIPVVFRQFKTGWFEIECKVFGIIASGSNSKEALEELYDFIQNDLLNYVGDDDSNLTQDAIKLKQAYLYYFG